LDTIGRYQVLGQIGQGGFGRVFRALDPVVGRHVAIKTIAANGDRALVERLRKEAMTTARLRHENIVTILDFGEHEGDPYVVMELVEGLSLDEVIERPDSTQAGSSLIEHCDMLVQIADGLSYAHSRGVVHSDIKPLNIVREADGKIKILDFGFARVLDAAETMATRTGHALTVMFMSPEQMNDSQSDVLTDIFSFGSTAYNLLSGQHPFPGNDVATVMYRISACKPMPIRQINPDIPERLAEIVHRCLSRERDARYQSMGDLHGDLHSVLDDIQKEAAEAMFVSIPAIAGDNLKDALQKIRQVLGLNPAHSRARALRSELESQQRERNQRRKLDALISQGDELAEGRAFFEAISKYEAALLLSPSEADILQKIETVRTQQQRRRSTARLVVDARSSFSAGEVEAALEKVQTALSADPENAEARALHDAIIAEQQHQEFLARRNDEIQAVEVLMVEAALDTAAEKATELSTVYPDDQLVAALRERVLHAIALRNRRWRRDQFQENVREIEEANSADELDRAYHLARELAAEFGEEAEAATILADFEQRVADRDRQVEIGGVSRTIREAVEENRLDEAKDRLTEAITKYGDDQALAALRPQVQEALTGRERQRAIATLVDRADRAIASSDFSIISELETAVSKYPESENLASVLARAVRARAEQERQSFVQVVRTEVLALADSRKWKSAFEKLQKALARYPNDPALVEGQGALERRLEEYKAALTDKVETVETAIATDQLNEALILSNALLDEHPHDIQVLRAAAHAWREARRREIQKSSQYLRDCLSRDDIDGAGKLVRAILPVFPEDTSLKLLISEIDQRQTARESFRKVDSLIQSQRFDEASTLLNALAVPNESYRREILSRQQQIVAQKQKLGKSTSRRESPGR
jgi:serine/threonine protein kinase